MPKGNEVYLGVKLSKKLNFCLLRELVITFSRVLLCFCLFERVNQDLKDLREIQ